MNRPLRVMLLLVGLVPAFSLLAGVGYGFVGPNSWAVTSHVDVEAGPQDVVPLTEDVRKWRDWLLVAQSSDPSFETVQSIHVTGAGAILQWNTGFETGAIQLVNEWEDATMYALDFAERRAGRPRQAGAGPNAQPSAWTESEGALVVEPSEAGVRLTLGQRGEGGPRPLGPYLLGAVKKKRQSELDQRLLALAELVEARAERRRLGEP